MNDNPIPRSLRGSVRIKQMLRGKLISLASLGLILCASVGYTLSHAWYYRSADYRQACADYLAKALQLPADIGGVIPRSRLSQEFTNVAVWLPERRSRIFYTPSAVVYQLIDDPERVDLQLYGGMAEVSARTWLRSDYRGVLESGLRPGLTDNAVRQMRFAQMNISLDSGDYQLDLGDAKGRINFDSDRTGDAGLECHVLNGQQVDEPVTLRSRFSMRESGIQIDNLEVTVPRLPIGLLRLEGILGVVPSQGAFAGRLALNEVGRRREINLTGTGTNLSLSDLTRGILPQPLQGSCPELEVSELRVVNNFPTRLVVRGLIEDVELAEPFELAKLPALKGRVSLKLRRAEIDPNGLELLVATGSGKDLEPGDLTRAWGWGEVSGRVHIRIHDLLIRNNRIEVLVAHCRMAAADLEEQWVDTSVLQALISMTSAMEFPNWIPLPSRIAYERFDFRIEVRDEELFILGGHGPENRTILTLNLLGRSIGLIKQPETAIPLEPMLDQLRYQLKRQIANHQAARLRSLKVE